MAILLCAVAVGGCRSTVDIRVENVSAVDFRQVRIAGQAYGDVPAGAITDFKPVRLFCRYGVLRFTARGHSVTAQTLNFRARLFTYRVAVKDLAAGHLDVDVVPERRPP